jgi:hypothetical protein
MRRGRFRGPGCEFSGIYENKNYPRKQTVFTAESLAQFPALDSGLWLGLVSDMSFFGPVGFPLRQTTGRGHLFTTQPWDVSLSYRPC